MPPGNIGISIVDQETRVWIMGDLRMYTKVSNLIIYIYDMYVICMCMHVKTVFMYSIYTQVRTYVCDKWPCIHKYMCIPENN